MLKKSFFLFQVQEMTTLIRKAFISNLDSADWMDAETKEAAKEKVRLKLARGWRNLPEFQLLPQNGGNLISEDLNFLILWVCFPIP